VVSQILDLDELLENAVNQIRTRFKHYHVQIFLVNETRDQVLLVASTGDIGKRLLGRGHQLAVGSQSVVGQVVLRGGAVVVNDTSYDAVYYRNELLPETRAELALPIREGTQITGVLDIQSVAVNSFSKSDIQALQIMADLLATAIRNARLFKEQAGTVQENERLYRDSETNLREIQRLNQQLTRGAWQAYQRESQAATGITLERDRVVVANEWSEHLIRAGLEGRVVEADESHRSVAVPVMLRGEVIGAIEVEPGTESRQETVEMVQAVANRLALSLENARLYEATLQAAAQEQRINDIAARYQSVATVDELLRITLAELSETLGAQSGSIRLGRFSVEQGSTPV
jgi:GAF domain-containing protein